MISMVVYERNEGYKHIDTKVSRRKRTLCTGTSIMNKSACSTVEESSLVSSVVSHK